MWAAAARDVSSRSPPPREGHPGHERQWSIADSVVSTTVDEIRERYRLSVRETPTPPATSTTAAFRPPAHPRRDSIFSFNTQWTADESFLDSSGMISDFPRPPGTVPRFSNVPALPSSSGHVIPPSSWGRMPSELPSPAAESQSHFTESDALPSSSLHDPLQPPRPLQSTRPTQGSPLTVRTDNARYLDPNSHAPVEIVHGPSPTTPSPTSRFPPSPVRPTPTTSPRSLRPPSSPILPPLPRSASPNSQYLVPTPSPTEKVPGFPVAPPSPATAAFLREPVVPPSSHASHEGLLDPGFIRTLMSGIEGGQDLSLSSEESGPFGDRYAVEAAYYQENDDDELEPPPIFRRPLPAASLPSSPRSSFSFSVRSGVGGNGWREEDVPAVPPIPALYRTAVEPSSGSSASPPAPVTPTSVTPSTNNGTLRPDWNSRRRSAGKETIASGSGMSTVTAGGASSGGLSGITERSASTEEAVVQHAALVRTASVAEMRPAVYTSAPTSPQTYAGDARWSALSSGGHARTTSADLLDQERAVRNRRSAQQLQFLAATHPDVRRARSMADLDRMVEEEGDDLVYVRAEDMDRRDSTFTGVERDSVYTRAERESTYTGAGRESTYTGIGRESTFAAPGQVSTYLEARRQPSSYVAPWAEPPSPNEATPALGSPHYASLRTPATPGHSTPGAGPSTLSPMTPGFSTPTQTFSAMDAKRAKRVSTTSFVSSVFSKFSGHASAGHQSGSKTFAFSWRSEDVPPLPTPNPNVMRAWGVESTAHSDSTRMSTVVRREGTMELPQLAQRAEKLNEMLELGKLPYRSKSSLPSPRVVDVPVGVDHEGNDVMSITGGFTGEKPPRRTRSIRSVFTTLSDRSRRFVGGGSASLRSSLVDIPGQQNMRFNKLPEEPRRKVQWSEGTGVKPPRPPRRVVSKRKMYFITGGLVAVVIAIICLAVGLSQGLRRKPDAGGHTCKVENQTGNLCDLDATCSCTSDQAGLCNPLANAITELIEPVNRFFNPSPAFTRASVALSLWEIQGSPLPGANCANQANLIDVGPALSSSETGSLAANRTQFARSALLWTLVMSMDVNGTARMQKFIQDLDFGLYDSSTAGEYMFGAAGFQVDFGTLTVSQPAVSWQSAGRPSDEQVGLVSGEMKAALDRVYTFAAASSAQRATALKRYWTNVLQFPAGQLDTFRSVAKSSPVLLPFDATASNIRPMFTNVNQSFPPPAACYPGLSTDELGAINTMETKAFGLDPVTSAPSNLDSSCFPSRPVYGVLDIPRFRTPFVEGSPRQAVQLASAANSRISVHVGRDLAGIPSAPSHSANATGVDDTRTFGTLDNMDHVLLLYLQAFPSIQAAGALVQYVLDASDPKTPPPTNTSTLFNLTSSLDSMPILEVALFGSVGPSDLSASLADFSTADGQLFFGSSDADAFRNWAMQRTGSVVWADGALATQVVRETTKDETFEMIWKGANGLLGNAQTTGTKTSRRDVQQVVDAFGNVGYMGS
ncbi:Zinc finger protein GLI2 [Ceratobasidium sp. AG-Ba]|nr:Zinc finger protein GLI2 [Ceratobasidium sp. AG-Ba]